jgi:hypothetical protein
MTYIGDANDPATILADAKVFFSTYFPADSDSKDSQLDWEQGRRIAALVQVYDLMAQHPSFDPGQRAAQYLERLGRIAGALLALRDDLRTSPPVHPVDGFRNRVMAAWGATGADRDYKWNTDVVTAGLFTYAMAAFARRVADDLARYPQHRDRAIRFITATIETYQAFRPELHLDDGDPHAYFKVPAAYAGLKCDSNDDHANNSCDGYRATAGQELSYNENLSMMKALAEVALAADSALYRGSADATPERLQLATEEAPLLIAKNVAFFVDNLQPNTLPDGTPYFYWKHQKPTWHQQTQNTPHGGFEVGSLAVLLDLQVRLDALLARAGRAERVPLNPRLFVGLANTFLYKIWRQNVLSGSVAGGNPDEKFNIECAGWIPLAQFNPWVWTLSRDTTFHRAGAVDLREDNHAALLRYRQFNSRKFAGQNWLITPAALAVGESPPASIHEQKWLLVLSGVVIADLKGDDTAQWNHQTISFMPDMAGSDDPSSTSGPLNWAINRYSIPKPPGAPGAQYLIRFSVEEWAPFVSPNAIFNQGQSINSGFAVDAWRPNHFGNGRNALTNQPVNNLFTGINADLAVRDTDAWLYRLGYNITLLGKIVFVAPILERPHRPQPGPEVGPSR